MARRSLRVSNRASSTPAHKRAASNGTPISGSAKRSKKAAPPGRPKKIEDTEDDDDDEDLEASSADDPGASEYGEEEEDDDVPPTESEESDEYDSDEGVTSRKEGSARKGKPVSTTVRTKEGELWRPGVKTGLGPGTQVIIKKPKARPAGKTPYSDDTIHPNTMLFLRDLKENNDRQWLKMHDADFRKSQQDWYSFAEQLTERLIEIDDTVPELPVKDVIFRIYRDVRFSSDPTPYKPHFSAAWSRTGRKGPYAHYYVRISPQESFVGGGLWLPESAPTAAMRRDIDRRSRRLKDVLLNDSIRKELLGGVGKTDAKVVKAFVAANSENALKTKPKGYDADHADIELLRLRNYTIGKKLAESEITAPYGLDTIANLLTALKPFITYLNSVVMPDPDEDGEVASDDDASEGSEEEEEDEEEDEDNA